MARARAALIVAVVMLAAACTNSVATPPQQQFSPPPASFTPDTTSPGPRTTAEVRTAQSIEVVGLQFDIDSSWRMVRSSDDIERLFGVFGSLDEGSDTERRIVDLLNSQAFELFTLDVSDGTTLYVTKKGGDYQIEAVAEVLLPSIQERGLVFEQGFFESDSETKGWFVDQQIQGEESIVTVSQIFITRAGTLYVISVESNSVEAATEARKLAVNSIV